MFGDNGDSNEENSEVVEQCSDLPARESEDSGPYSFIDTDQNDAEGQAQADSQPQHVQRWGLGDHTTADDEQADDIQSLISSLDDEVDDDLKGVLNEAASMVGGSSLSRFECSACGLIHRHSDRKHDIRSAFNVSGEFADKTDFCPYCHCGVNELAMIVDFYGFIGMEVFQDAHRFEGVRRLPNEVVQDIFRTLRDLESEAVRSVSMEEAIAESGYRYQIPEGVTNDLSEFYERVEEIKSAAESAPIPGETRVSIEETREALEEMVASA